MQIYLDFFFNKFSIIIVCLVCVTVDTYIFVDTGWFQGFTDVAAQDRSTWMGVVSNFLQLVEEGRFTVRLEKATLSHVMMDT